MKYRIIGTAIVLVMLLVWIVVRGCMSTPQPATDGSDQTQTQ